MIKKLTVLLACLWCFSASTQSVQQSGNVTPGHAACWAITGVVYDCGLPAGSSILGSYTANDLVAVNGSGSLIDSGISAVNTSNITALWNFNGGATAPTKPLNDISTNVATTAFVQASVEVFRPEQYGAVGNGIADDTVPLQTCITSAQASGAPCYLTQAYAITSTILIQGIGTVQIYGSKSFDKGPVVKPATNISAFTVNTGDPVLFKDFTIEYASQSAANTWGIKIDSSVGVNNFSKIEGMFINFAWQSIYLGSVQYTRILGNYAANFGQSALLLNSVNAPSGGDIKVIGNTFVCDQSTFCVYHVSMSGVVFEGNKIVGDNSANTTGYFLQLPNSGNQSDVLIIGNSIENVQNGVFMDRSVAGSAFVNFQVSDNEFLGAAGGCAVCLITDASGIWVFNLIISNNTLYGAAAGANFGYIINAATAFSVVNNVTISNNGSDSMTPVSVSSVPTNGFVGFNIRGGAGIFANDSILSTSTAVAGTPISGGLNFTSTNWSLSTGGALILGNLATASGGTVGLAGSSSGAVTIQPQAAAGTYNFNLPTTAGTSGQSLVSAGGGAAPMTWGGPFSPAASPTFTGTVTMPDSSTWTSSGVGPLTVTGQLRTTFGTPTIASGACGTGTNGSVAGSNQAGLVTVGASATTTCTVSFSTTLANAPAACIVTQSAGTAELTKVTSVGTASFVITGATMASTSYYYICI